MLPPRKVRLQDKRGEADVQYVIEDVYKNLKHDDPTSQAEWAALTTTAEKLNYLAKLWGLV
jgi:hypothetical protein